MLLALTALSSGWVAAFYIVALVIILVAAFRACLGRPERPIFPRVDLLALGIAVVVFVLAWQALASTR